MERSRLGDRLFLLWGWGAVERLRLGDGLFSPWGWGAVHSIVGGAILAHPLVSPTVEGRLGEALEWRVPAESDESDNVLCLC